MCIWVNIVNKDMGVPSKKVWHALVPTEETVTSPSMCIKYI